MTARIFTWDWKEHPDLDAIAAAVREISGGKVFMEEYDTGGDTFAWIVSDHEISPGQARELFMKGQ